MKLNEIIAALIVFNTLMPAATANGEILRSGEIISWDNMSAPKGFVLSKYLYENQNCSLIWEKQLPEFQKKNPHVEDPDVIAEGTKVIVQKCSDSPSEVADSSTSEVAVTDRRESNSAVIDQTPGHNTPKKVVASGSEEEWDGPAPYFHLYGGFITENESDQVDAAYGLGISGDILKFVGYDLRVLGGTGAIFLQNEVIFKTAPGKTRGQLIVGFGNRMGLQNKDLDRLNKGVDSFTYAGFGVEMNPHPRYRFQMDITGNISQNITPNFGVSAQKKFGEDFWLGLYGEVQSSQSMVDEGKDRRFYTGGLKLSF